MHETHQPHLKKEIGFFSALSTVTGTVIGAGVFFKAATVFNITGTASLGMLTWFLGGVITICAGLTGAELAAAIPKTGGMIKYIEYTYGNFASFLLGWAQTMIYLPASIAALAIIFATQAEKLMNVGNFWITPIAILTVISLTLINFLGSKTSGIVQSIAFVCKLIPLFAIVLVSLTQTDKVTVHLLPMTSAEHIEPVAGLGMGLLATMFAYDGWMQVGTIAEEMKNPQKDLPRAIFWGLCLVMMIYLLVNFAFLQTLPITESAHLLPLKNETGAVGTIAANPNAAMNVATKLFGQMGGKVITIGILISVYGTMNGFIMTGMRIPYAMALEKRLPFSSLWTHLSKRTSIPITSGLLMMGLTIVMIFSGQFESLTSMVVFVIWIFYTLSFTAVIVLRKREPELHRPYKVPFYPWIPFIAIIGGSYIIIDTLFSETKLALIGIGLTLIGIPFYFYLDRKYDFEHQKQMYD